MDTVQTRCPACNAAFQVAPTLAGKRARCKGCGHVFIINAPALEDSVMLWLDDDKLSATETVAAVTHAAAGAIGAAKPTDAAGSGVVDAPTAKPLHLARLDTKGAIFIFPPELLTDPEFRSSLPHTCLRCGARTHLKLRLLAWPTKPDPGVLARLPGEKYEGLQGAALLGALPRLEERDSPFDLPMPYFSCTDCASSTAAATDMRHDSEGRMFCRMGMVSFKQAAEFAAANLGADSEACRRLLKAHQQRKENPWKALPLPVRNRIGNWFKPHKGERFVCYVRDTDFAKSEEGVAGIVLTDQRIIYQKLSLHEEMPIDQPFEFGTENTRDHYSLRLGAPRSDHVITLHCRPRSAETFRQGLRKVGAKYTFKR